jgi:hypothetical protein
LPSDKPKTDEVSLTDKFEGEDDSLIRLKDRQSKRGHKSKRSSRFNSDSDKSMDPFSEFYQIKQPESNGNNVRDPIPDFAKFKVVSESQQDDSIAVPERRMNLLRPSLKKSLTLEESDAKEQNYDTES